MKDGGAAFPLGMGAGGANEGMSLRDYIAIEAAKPMIAGALKRGMGEQNPERLKKVIEIGIPPEAYAFADAMLLEREKTS